MTDQLFCRSQFYVGSLGSSDSSHLTVLSAWVSNNVEGSYKRSVSLAMGIGLCVYFTVL